MTISIFLIGNDSGLAYAAEQQQTNNKEKRKI